MQKQETCRRPPNTASKQDLILLHKEKMMGKHFRNQEPGRVKEQPIRANVGRKHPDYGKTPDEHFINKTERELKARLKAKKGKK